MHVGLITDLRMLKHRCETGDHPERPERLTAILTKLTDTGLRDRMRELHGRAATDAELLLAHSPAYIRRLENQTKTSAQRRELEKKYDSVYLHPETVESARWATGSLLHLASEIVLGHLTHGFALVRPPGHHATRDHASGFCIFNHVAIAAKWAAAAGLRVGVFDWDVHHGDGTQSLLEDTHIPFVSVHRYDKGAFYPGSGPTGKNRHRLNVGFDGPIDDDEYLQLFHHKVTPALGHGYDLLFVSAGFDAAKGDPLGACHLTEHAYSEMVRELKTMTHSVICVLEGGYRLSTISRMSVAVVDELLRKI